MLKLLTLSWIWPRLGSEQTLLCAGRERPVVTADRQSSWFFSAALVFCTLRIFKDDMLDYTIIMKFSVVVKQLLHAICKKL